MWNVLLFKMNRVMEAIRKICVCVALVAVAAACIRTNRQESESDALTGVRVMVVDEVSSVHYRTYAGEAEALRSVMLTAPYPGRLSALSVVKGGRVGQGDVVAEVESDAVKSSYEMSQASLKQAEDGYERLKKVYGSGGIPEVKMVEMETAMAKAEASAYAAEKALEACMVKAPFDGTVGDIFCHQGEELQVAAPIIKIVDEKSIEIRFSVPESEISGISEGASALVDIPALGLSMVRAEVVAKGVEAAPLSHAYECFLKTDEPVKGLLPGMVCKVMMDSDVLRGNIVPANVIQRDMNSTYVWTVKEGRVCRTDLVLDGFAGKGVLVKKGLSKGDLVIVEGFQKVSTGMKVKVISE